MWHFFPTAEARGLRCRSFVERAGRVPCPDRRWNASAVRGGYDARVSDHAMGGHKKIVMVEGGNTK
ncbi:hypothetical protein SAMN00808754_1682 [Thermanaeromonas toyohensis ToBE]|uniref:Uncharacterized protein n=1 Tax=Thermanaeromonas toyohensis ToBE TaxID=698762 RepID=A0A1W1VU98_9FIRM|nr:hypothetical protein [Thermanaeromonas toyohensis]SMB96843.1 hypothetical protein SAMN00808754_1682 [Thermanaeromonas toyohensis ToBE]